MVLVVLGAILVVGAVTPEEVEDFRTEKGHYRTPEAPKVGANRTPEVVLLGFLAHILVEQGDFELEFAQLAREEVVQAESVEGMAEQLVLVGFEVFVDVVAVAV